MQHQHASQASPATPAQARYDGWVGLFDGTSTEGWRCYNATGIGAAWQVEGGNLHLHASPQPDGGQASVGGDIVFDREFGDCHLDLE